MSARPQASATISFGLVSIPVRLYTATESGSSISFNLLHGKDGGRLKQQYVCTKDGEIVPRSDMVKGYEFAKDQYVTFTDEELKSFAEAATKLIEIAEFLPMETVDPIYFEGTTYLGPDKGGEKAYKLLTEAMRKSGRVALAKWAARGKQYLVLLRPSQDHLVMQQLFHVDEIRPVSEVPLGDAKVTEPELQLALQLIDQIAHDAFRPEQYEDDVKKRIQTAIDQKVAGQEVTAAPAEAPRAQIVDLMEALKASLAGKAAGSSKPSADEAASRRAPKHADRPVAARPARAAKR